MTRNNKNGYVLLTVIFTIALSAIIVSRLLMRSNVYNSLIPIVIKKEQAQQLALAGIHIACSQLALQDSKIIDQNGQSEKQKELDEKKNFFKTILTINNQWQVFPLEDKYDGIDGKISLYVSCEDGKININNIYDFKKHVFIDNATDKKSGEKLIGLIADKVNPLFKSMHLKESLIEFLKNRKGALPDITLFLDDPQFIAWKDQFFYSSSVELIHQKKIYFGDIFTIWTGSDMVNPWLLSRSLKLLFNFSEQPFDSEVISMYSAKVDSLNCVWEKDWSTYLQPVYGKSYVSIPSQFIPFLSSVFEANTFSVLSYGTVGNITERLVAVIQKINNEQGQAIEIKKIYWLSV